MGLTAAAIAALAGTPEQLALFGCPVQALIHHAFRAFRAVNVGKAHGRQDEPAQLFL
jgi:hypothetical protein